MVPKVFEPLKFDCIWEIAVHLAVAGNVFDGVFYAVFFPRDVFDEIWDLIESVSEGFPTYSCLNREA